MNFNQFNQFNQYHDPNEVIYAEVLPVKSSATKWLLIGTSVVVVACLGLIAFWFSTRKSPVDYIEQSNALVDDGKLEEALEKIERAVELDKETMRPTYYRAWLNFQLKNYKAAIKDCKACINRGYQIRESEVLVCRCLTGLRRFDEAIDNYERHFNAARWRIPIDELNANNGLAWCYAVAGKNLNRAMRLANRALLIAGQHRGKALYEAARGATLDTRGYIYYLQGKYAAALKDLDQAIKQSLIEYDKASSRGRNIRHHKKTLGLNYYHRSLVHDKLKQKTKAEADRARVRELGFEPTDELNF